MIFSNQNSLEASQLKRTPFSPGDFRKRRPFIPIVIASAAGILIDEYFRWPFIVTLTGTLLFLILWFLTSRKRSGSNASWLLLASILCLFSSWHHWRQFVQQEDDISRYSSHDWKLVKVKGTITEPVVCRSEEIRYSYQTFLEEKSSLILNLNSVASNQEWKEVSGFTRVQVEGNLESFLPGDSVVVSGWLARTEGPDNPGEFDFQSWMRRKSIRTFIYCEHPLSIRFQEKTNQYPLIRFLTHCRQYSENLIDQYLDDENRGIAKALLLGDRTGISRDTSQLLAESGMIHLISISGFHVGFLALMIHFFCRVSGLGVTRTAWFVILLLIIYAAFTGGRPPVVRATIVISCTYLALVFNRQSQLYNILAFSIFILLLINPSNLFDTGAQLSYLSIIGLVEGSRIYFRFKRIREQDRLRQLVKNRTRFHQLLNQAGSVYLQSAFVMAGIFLANFPLIETRFHMISLSGFLMNLLFMPVAGFFICASYLGLFLMILFPFSGEVSGSSLNQILGTFMDQVRFWTGSPGHLYSPGYPEWWLIIFYLVLLVMVLNQFRNLFFRKVICFVFLLWSCLGLTLIFNQDNSGKLEGTFISVGHGTSVLLEFPNGKTLLYDAGSLNNGRYAANMIKSVLWSRGKFALDAIVISHADIDHCNAVPGILDQVPTGCLITTPTFLDFQQPVVEQVCLSAHQNKIPLELVARDDKIQIDSSVSVRVIHPEAGMRYLNDNENSLVLLIEYQGVRILLPGDIEGEGLIELIRSNEGNFDLFMTPHHGSLRANEKETIEWASTKFAVTSGANRRVSTQLKERYGTQTELYSTNSHGAVSFSVTDEGEFSIRSKKQYFRDEDQEY